MSGNLDTRDTEAIPATNAPDTPQAVMRPEALGNKWLMEYSDYIPEEIKEEILGLRSSIIALFADLEYQERFEVELKPHIYRRINEICINIARGFKDIEIWIGGAAIDISVWRDFVTQEKFDYFENGLNNLRFAQRSLTLLSESLKDSSSSPASS